MPQGLAETGPRVSRPDNFRVPDVDLEFDVPDWGGDESPVMGLSLQSLQSLAVPTLSPSLLQLNPAAKLELELEPEPEPQPEPVPEGESIVEMRARLQQLEARARRRVVTSSPVSPAPGNAPLDSPLQRCPCSRGASHLLGG
jgi:hypothetical protein